MSAQGKVIFVDDEKHIRHSRKQTLELVGYEVSCFSNPKDALAMISPRWAGIIVTDIKMPDMDGFEFLQQVIMIDKEIPVVVMTGHGDVPMAVKAMRLGAYDFIEKPCSSEHFLEAINRAIEKRKLILENRILRSEIESQKSPGVKIIGKSPSIEQLKQVIRNVADSNVDVLIQGETGTGKELIARYLHDQSKRNKKSFVPLNCGGFPETIIESELFGHEAGAFTGAEARRIGKFEHADGGTIFLDEIESMPLNLQVKLLRVIQERVIERLGSNEIIPVDIRVVAATKVDLKEASQKNEFREDLFYRLNVVKVDLPALRERREDIPLLFQFFVAEACDRYNYEVPIISRDTIQNLMLRSWEGNVRELKNEAERFVLGMSLKTINEGVNLPKFTLSPQQEKTLSLATQVDMFEKTAIEQELIRQKGDIKKTYTALGIPRQTLYDKMNKYGLKRKEFI